VGFKAPQLKYRIDEERNPHQVRRHHLLRSR
jgi:hypothetical protein